MTEFLKYSDCRGRQITPSWETTVSNHIADTNVHLTDADRLKLNSIINPDDVVSTEDLTNALSYYYTKTEIDNKAFIDADYLSTNKYINEEYLELHDKTNHYTKEEIDEKIDNVEPGNTVTVDESNVTITNNSKIKLHMDQYDKISLVIYTPVSASLSCSQKEAVEWDTAPFNVTLTVTFANGDSGNTGTISASQDAESPTVTTFTNNGSTSALIKKNDITTYVLTYHDGTTTTNKTSLVSVQYAKAVVYGNVAITASNFKPVTAGLTRLVSTATSGSFKVDLSADDSYAYFACPSDWVIDFNDGNSIGGWIETETTFAPYTEVSYKVYRCKQAKLGKDFTWYWNKK